MNLSIEIMDQVHRQNSESRVEAERKLSDLSLKQQRLLFFKQIFSYLSHQDSLSIATLISKYNNYFQVIEIFIYFLQQLQVNLGLFVQKH